MEWQVVRGAFSEIGQAALPESGKMPGKGHSSAVKVEARRWYVQKQSLGLCHGVVCETIISLLVFSDAMVHCVVSWLSNEDPNGCRSTRLYRKK